jgi:serine/threonine protein kinase
MALEKSRIVEAGETAYDFERAALDFAIQQLPNAEPYHAWTLCELVDPPTGRLYEIDLIVLGYSALYLIEIKSGPGRYVGDSVDWHRFPNDGSKPRYMDPPLKLTNHKAKVLKTRLEKKMKAHRAPWVEALVFLSAPENELQLDLREDGKVRVVTRSGFLDAVKNHKFFGADDFRKPPRINAAETRDIVQAMAAVGLQRRKGQAYAGQYALGEVLFEGSGFQDRSAVHRTLDGMRRRARVYLVPQQTSIERRQQLRRAAEREAHFLYGLREHPNILSFIDHETDAPLGPTVLFDDFEGGIPLPAFLRKEANITFEERIEIVCQVGRALHFCHQKEIIHRALSPDAVLVRRHPDDGRIDTRLFNFQLAEGERATGTAHWSQLASEPWALYQAPELREDPSRGSEVTDIFSLGAVAYYVLTGKDPGASLREVDERLIRDGWLEPAAVVDHIPEPVADMIREATARTPALRQNDLLEWVEFLAGAAKSESPAEPREVAPLDAGPADMLGGDLMVEKVLGHGATSRVLQVTREKDNTSYALKVSLSEEQDPRLREEGDALAALRHPRITQLVDRRTIGGRVCLLLSLAGTETLQSYLAREGSVSLDYAARFGEDLLNALEYLQDEGIIHRDIKPANLGVGADGKKSIHLSLFDFSLVKAAPSDLHVGTSAYRDPFLSLRGGWDAAADRYSAAVTLHEMLTAVRPTLAPGKSHLDPDAEVLVSAERFDPSCRDALARFFERAFARDAEKRFASAKLMRQAWERLFRADSDHPVPKASESRPRPRDAAETRGEEGWAETALRVIAPETPIDRLPISTRARNALDRAGVMVARDLLLLPDNRLSAVRGVGSLVAKEVVEFRAAWKKATALEAFAAEPFFNGYRGDDLLIATLGASGNAPMALHDAGLRTLRAIAGAPAAQIAQLGERHGFDPGDVRALLERENGSAAERSHPTTLEGWVDALVAGPKKRAKYILSLYGLTEPFVGRLDVSAAEVAAHHAVTRANLYIAIGEYRAVWEKHPSIAELRALVRAVLEESAGAISLARAAAGLVGRLVHDRSAPEALTQARAAALVRIVAEVEKEASDGLSFVRLYDRPWIVASEAHAVGLRGLGAACDALAGRDVLASWGEVCRVLEQAAKDTPFATLSAEILARLGTEASPRAACSARQEIYPSGMPAARALELCAPLLRGGLSPDVVAARVAARYPEAETLPPRPALDALLAPHQLVFDGHVYHRPGEREPPTSLQTSFSSLPKQIDEHAADFDARLRNAVERGGLRVVGVRAMRAETATIALGKRLGVTPIDLSAALLEQMRVLQAEGEVEDDALHKADVDADASPETWGLLRKLASDAAERVAETLLPPTAPLVLAQPGLFARYQLVGFSERLREAADQRNAAPIFVVVPSRDVGRVPHLEGWGVAGAKAMWIPESWVTEANKAG